VVNVEKAKRESAKAQEISNSQSVSSSSTNVLAAPHTAKAKISSIWSTLWCFRTQESHIDAEIIEGKIEEKQITVKKAAESPKLRLKGRIFLHNITSVHTYNENG
jgi:hypothetical protein